MATNVKKITAQAMKAAATAGAKVLTPDFLVLVMLDTPEFIKGMENMYNDDAENIISDIKDYIEDNYVAKLRPTTTVPSSLPESEAFKAFMAVAVSTARYEGLDKLYVHNLVQAISTCASSLVFRSAFESTSIDLDDLAAEIKKVEKISSSSPSKATMSHSGSDEDTSDALNYLTDMSEAEKSYKFPFIGRADVIYRAEQICSRMTKNNVIFLGKPGVGKTAITIGLQRKINNKEVPEKLQNNHIFELSISSLMAGTQYRGDLEKRLKMCLEYLANEVENPICYIDEIHCITGSGSCSGSSLDIANLLKPYLTTGKIKFIGSTTEEEYKKYIEPDKALSRRFQTVTVNEPTRDEAIKMIEGILPAFEEYHSVKYTKEAIEASVDLSTKYIRERYLPDKAIDLIDEAGARSSLEKNKSVTDVEIQKIMSSICNIPAEVVEKDETDALAHLYENLTANVYGQDDAAQALTDSILMSRAGLNQPNKPQGCYLMVGPTGVGKTEIAKTLADTLQLNLLRFDMSEYMEAHSVSKLIGAPAGYVGYGDGGQLVDAVRKTPNCVILFDEIEKANPAVFNVLLQVMDNAELTDTQGRKADFRNAIILMTSNCGASEVGKAQIGFGRSSINMDAIDENVNKTFSPEFRNRLTKIIVFNPLSTEMANLIADKALRGLQKLLAPKNVLLTWTDNVKAKVAADGITPEFGGREVVRVVDRDIKPLFVKELLFGSLTKGGEVQLDVVDGNYVLNTKSTTTLKKKTSRKKVHSET